MRLINTIFSLTLFFSISTPLAAEQAHLAVATNFAHPLRAISKIFEDTTGHTLQLSFASSGKHYAQIRNGAPFDVFFSADQDKPKQLVSEKLAIEASRFTYAVGALALWSADDTLITDGAEILREGLREEKFHKLAIANPKLAPFGLAATEVLNSLDLKDALDSRLVIGENIAQTYQFVSSGNAELGFVSLSQVVRNGKIERGSAWIVPSYHHQAINQDAVLLERGKNNAAAKAFLRFMRSEQVTQIIQGFAYSTVAE